MGEKDNISLKSSANGDLKGVGNATGNIKTTVLCQAGVPAKLFDVSPGWPLASIKLKFIFLASTAESSVLLL